MQGTLHHLVAVWMQFVLDRGYLGVFLMMLFESTAVPIPAEVVIPPAAYWAAQGRFNIWLIVIAATLGSWVGSALSYWVAYKLGRPLVARYGKYVLLKPAKIEKADLWFGAYGAGGIFVARLLPGIRHLISIPAGLFRMNFKSFSVMTVIGAGLFNGALSVDLNPLTTGSASMTSADGMFCPNQTHAGVFGRANAQCFRETGSPAGDLTDGMPHAATEGTVFCIPQTANQTVNLVADLPGPGATSLPGMAQLHF